MNDRAQPAVVPSDTDILAELRGVSQIFASDGRELIVLQDVTLAIPPGEVVRLTEDEVLHHPLFFNFGSFSDTHPPMRGWLATSVCGAGGRLYGLLQLSDKSGGRDFDASDEEGVRELAALIGETLDALSGGASEAG